jgi:hypothetical protein
MNIFHSDSNSDCNLELRKDNVKLTEQLTEVAEKYKARESHYFKNLEMVQEHEKLMREKVNVFKIKVNYVSLEFV